MLKDSTHTNIIEAAWRGNMVAVKNYIKNGTPIDTMDRDYTLLMMAASSNNTELIKYLLKKGVDVNKRTSSDETALHFSAWKGNLEAVKAMVEKGADVNVVYKANGGLTPLSCAAESGSLATVKYLIEKGANPLSEEKGSGASPLRSAAYRGHFEVFKLFAEMQPNTFDWNTGLAYAIRGHNLDIIKYVVEIKKADVNSNNNPWSEYIIQTAANNRWHSHTEEKQTNSVEIIKYLVSKGAKLTNINHGDIIPWAIEHSNEKTMEYFLKQGIKIPQDRMVENRWPLLPSSLDNGNFVIARELLKEDKNPVFGNSPLVVFFADGMHNSPYIINLLIENGVNKEHYSEAYLRSVFNSDLASTKLLLDAGADINFKSNAGNNALYYSNNKDLAKYLIEKGIDTKDVDSLATRWSNFGLQQALSESNITVPISKMNANRGLWLAAETGNEWAVKFYLSKGADVNSRRTKEQFARGYSSHSDAEIYGSTALIENARQGYAHCSYDDKVQIPVTIAKILIDAGANLNIQDDSGKTALHYTAGWQWCRINIWPIPMGNRQERLAGAHGDPASPPEQQHDLILQLLIDSGANKNIQDKEGNTPLHHAVKNNNHNALRMLLAAKANTQLKDKDGKTMFDYINDGTTASILKEFNLDKQINKEAANKALEKLILDFNFNSYRYKYDELRNLVKAGGADINHKYDSKNHNALMYVLDFNVYPEKKLEMVNELINLGIDINAADRQGRTALMYAIEKIDWNGGTYASIEIVKRLLEAGADINQKDNYGISAYGMAQVYSFTDVISLFGTRKPKRDLAGEWRYALYAMWKDTNIEKLKKLVADGADINLKVSHNIHPYTELYEDDKGITALMHAVNRREAKKVKALIELGADVSVKDDKGLTALDRARKRGEEEIINILEKAAP